MTVPQENKRTIILDGHHAREVLNVLSAKIKFPDSLNSILDKAAKIIERSVDPISGPPEFRSDGLLYGLIQSGKTSIITVAAAMAADNGFQCIVILTSDIDLLYEQTLERLGQALRGLRVLGKNDWRDPARFERHLRTPPIVIVCSKNSSKLSGLLEAFRNARAKGLSALIIDDEADQASLNTLTSRGGAQLSRINEVITDLRNFFGVNTYLQVTATPQALFLQRPDHLYRPAFTILSTPGPGYVGGEKFFGEGSDNLLREVDLHEVDHLRSTHQPSPTAEVPPGLRRALLTFLVGAASKIMRNSAGEERGCFAFLCHVSVNKRDHNHIVELIDRFKEDTIHVLQDTSTNQYKKLIKELQSVYSDLFRTEPKLGDFSEILEKIKFYLPGTNVKLINATSNEQIKLDAAYNIFVGGNKLGRGVTIENLLVSYYGRNPRRPNSDTVLQHARMYGYRERDLGVTRLFLPDALAEHFRLIHQMESALRDLVQKYPDGKFEGLFLSPPLQATRRNVLDPNSIGIYVAGRSYNPAYPLRTSQMADTTKMLDEKLTGFDPNGPGKPVTIDFIIELLEKCKNDPTYGAELWNQKTIKAALEKMKHLYGNRAYLVIRRDRSLNSKRHETQGIISGGEDRLAPNDLPTLFLYRQNKNAKGEIEIWWPQLRFPEGNFVLAFSFDR